tara:strand:+ start:62 stop:1105 length:1044 start_codon:yes stop_codon:yes gene_type:complete
MAEELQYLHKFSLQLGASIGGVGSTWSATINESDKVQLTSDVDFTLTKTGTSDPFGFGSATLNATQIGSNYVVTAPEDWTRGLCELTNVLFRIDEVGTSDTFNFPILLSDMQDVTTFLRSHSESDSDNFSLTSLQEQDNSALGKTNITWTITDTGFTQCFYPSTESDISWTSTTLRDLLGFTGNEVPTSVGTFKRLTSTYKNSGVLIPSRPYQSHHLRVENISQSRRKIGGGYVSNFIGSYVIGSLAFDLDALLDESDDYRHFSERFLPLVGPGERINFYQGWGDSRRALRTDQVVGTQKAFDLLFTSEDNGDQGRVRGSLITGEFDLAYPTRLRRRVPVSLEIEHL